MDSGVVWCGVFSVRYAEGKQSDITSLVPPLDPIKTLALGSLLVSISIGKQSRLSLICFILSPCHIAGFRPECLSPETTAHLLRLSFQHPKITLDAGLFVEDPLWNPLWNSL